MVATIITELAAPAPDSEIVMIDATHAKAHRTASRLAVQKGPFADRGRPIGRMKGGLNSRLHVRGEAKGPVWMFLTAGQTSDDIGARAVLPAVPNAAVLLGIRGCRADQRHPFERTGEGQPVPQRPDRDGNFARYPVSRGLQGSGRARRRPLSPAPLYRDHVRRPQAPAPDRHALRAMPCLSARPRRDRHVLDMRPFARQADRTPYLPPGLALCHVTVVV